MFVCVLLWVLSSECLAGTVLNAPYCSAVAAGSSEGAGGALAGWLFFFQDMYCRQCYELNSHPGLCLAVAAGSVEGASGVLARAGQDTAVVAADGL